MAGNKVKCYLDVVEHHPDWTIEEFEEEEKKLKEESDKLKEWPELIGGYHQSEMTWWYFVLPHFDLAHLHCF